MRRVGDEGSIVSIAVELEDCVAWQAHGPVLRGGPRQPANPSA